MNRYRIKIHILKSKFITAILAVLLFQGCYSFKGIAIPPDVNSYVVENFQNSAPQAPGDINQRFSEALRSKIRNESRLVYNEQNPDIEFSGSITGFRLNPEAPQAGNTVALNKLEITVTVNFVNKKDESKSWKKPFSFFRTFESDKDFISIQDQLITEIFKQLMENIFNEAFTGW
jgi:Txe/YoeB family toxin of Txe-Axe toxin-antitoxin module